MKKTTILLRIAVLIEVDEAEAKKEHGEVDHMEVSIEDAINAAVGVDYGTPNLGWTSSQRIDLDEESMNCGHCAKCGLWVTDVERENPIHGLPIAATVNGELFCDDHLPKGHRHAF